MIDSDKTYGFDGTWLIRLRTISARLNDGKPMTWDDRRDAANMIDLMLMHAEEIHTDNIHGF